MASIYEQSAAAATKKAIQVPRDVRQGIADTKAVLSGDVDGLVDRAINALFGKYLISTQYQLLGGIPLEEVRAVYKQMVMTEWAKGNIWHIAIEDIKPWTNTFRNVNLFATDCSYAPSTISGENIPIGSGNYDQITNSERVELRITTRDDTWGSIKRWMKERAARMAAVDGTFGYPIDYLMRVTVTHAFSSPDVAGAVKAEQDKYIMRLGNIDYQKDRKSDQLEDITISLVQFDTWTSLQ